MILILFLSGLRIFEACLCDQECFELCVESLLTHCGHNFMSCSKLHLIIGCLYHFGIQTSVEK